MIAYIIVCVIIFIVIVISFNYQSIKSKIKLPKKSKKTSDNKQPKAEEQKKEDKKESNISYEESEYAPKVVVDDLDRDDDTIAEPFIKANEEEIKELENKPKNKAGRLRGDIPSVKSEEVKVEYLGEYDENEGFYDSDDFYKYDNYENSSSISEEIKNLPPEIKAMLLGNILNKKDE